MLEELSNIYASEGHRCLTSTKINSAILNLEKALLLNNNHYEAMNMLGLCYYTKGRLKEAESVWKRSSCIESGDDNKSIRYLGYLTENKFKQQCVVYNNALMYMKEGRYKKAVEIMEGCSLEESNIILFIKLKGLCESALGNSKESVRLWKKILKINEEDTEAVRYILCDVESKKNKRSIYDYIKGILKK